MLMSAWSCNVAFAQFYGAENKIYFYVCLSNDGVVPINPGVIVFNFDGEKATTFNEGYSVSINQIAKNLSSDIDYYEKKVFDVKYKAKYRSDKSTSSWIVYGIGDMGRDNGTHYYISNDRKTLKTICYNNHPTKVCIYKLVDKNYFLNKSDRRSRELLREEGIYE